MGKLSLCVVLTMAVVGVMGTGVVAGTEGIPPEILAQYAPEVLDGSRPSTFEITRDMIWDLRENPSFEGDLARFTFNASDLSTAEREVVGNWILSGGQALILGYHDFGSYLSLIDGVRGGFWEKHRVWSDPLPYPRLEDHVVNTDCESLSFPTYYADPYSRYRAASSSTWEYDAVVSIEGEVFAGWIGCGEGGIYVLFSSPTGRDATRWVLNWRQWILGLPVPGAASTIVSVATEQDANGESEIQQFDRIHLKNGDELTGQVLTSLFKVETSYATLSFAPEQIARILIEGSTQSTDLMILRNGDELSGVVTPELVSVLLQGGQVAEIEKDKISEIRFFQ